MCVVHKIKKINKECVWGYPSLSLWDKLSLKDACVLCGTYYNVFCLIFLL